MIYLTSSPIDSIIDAQLDQAAAELAEAIDQGVINSMIKESLLDSGWICAPITTGKFTWPFDFQLDTVAAWIHTNATDDYRIVDTEFFFKSTKDLTAFILRWS